MPRGQALLRHFPKLAMNDRDINPDLLKNTPLAHDGHDTTTSIFFALSRTPGLGPLKAPCRQIAASPVIFDSFKGRANLVAQISKPSSGTFFFGGQLSVHEKGYSRPKKKMQLDRVTQAKNFGTKSTLKPGRTLLMRLFMEIFSA